MTNEPKTLEDHCQLFLNLYRQRVPLTHPDWLILDQWAASIMRVPPLPQPQTPEKP